MEWSDEAITRLRAFWDEGLSTAEIGRRMGISKNAVVGKAHRLNLAARPSPIRRDGPPARSAGGGRRVNAATLPSMADPALNEALTAAPGASPVATVPAAAGAVPEKPALQPVRQEAAGALPEEAGAASPRDDIGTAGGGPLPPAVKPEPFRPEAAQPRPADIAVSRPIPRPVAPPRHAAPSFQTGGRLVSCCWPIGEPGTRDFRFCDAPAMAGKPYCAEHASLAYVKVRDRREDAA